MIATDLTDAVIEDVAPEIGVDGNNIENMSWYVVQA